MSVAAEDGRILSRAPAPDDAPFERALRPRSFDEYVGQHQAVGRRSKRRTLSWTCAFEAVP